MDFDRTEKCKRCVKTIFSTLANHARIAILTALQNEEKNVSQLVAELGFGQTHVSHNLKKLVDGGFVKVRKDGAFRYYALNEEFVEPLLTAADPGWTRTGVSDEEIFSALKAAPLSVAVVDRDGVYTHVSGEVMRRCGLKESQFVGRSVFEIYKADPNVCTQMRRALAGEEVAWKATTMGVSLEILSIPYKGADGAVLGVVSVVYPDTPRDQS